ncbi:MAG: ATP-binding protein [Candidatus Bipolaricaulia bacterium]
MQLERLAAQNPWWQDAGFIREDRHLQEFERSPIHWQPHVVNELTLEPGLIYTLRGPRQVGKTTLLKRLIASCLAGEQPGLEAPRSLLYLDCELAGITKPRELVDAITAYLAWSRALRPSTERHVLFLDEVTYIHDWAIGLKGLVDLGQLAGATVIATGSHAVDLKRGGERMPGRRGAKAGLDKQLLPMSFREYVETRRPELAAQFPKVADLDPQSLRKVARALIPLGEELRGLFERYLLSGGFPRPAAAEVADGWIPAYIYEIYRDAVLGDVSKLGRRESYFRELVSWITHRLGDPFGWRDVARETEIGKHDTVREYIEDLELAFLWNVVYRVKTLGAPAAALRSAKKVYFNDPFIFHTLQAWSWGLLDPWVESVRALADPQKRSKFVEAVVASHLRRFHSNFVYYFRNRREIDFVVYREGKLTALIEVKYQDRIFPEDWRPLARSGGGLLLSRSTLDLPEDGIVVIPVAYALALLASG